VGLTLRTTFAPLRFGDPNGFSAAAMADSRRTQQTAKGGVRAMSGPRAGCASVRDGLQPFRFAQWMPQTGQLETFGSEAKMSRKQSPAGGVPLGFHSSTR
jgi:hypothetical protein